MPLSVVINTKNAAAFLPKALSSVKWADEIVVVDMHSTDSTTRVARSAGARVEEYKDTQFVEPARNFAISLAKNDWILVLDADEQVSPELAKAIKEITTSNSPELADCYYIARSNSIFGKELRHTGWWPDYVLRLFRKGSVTWPETIHSVPVTKGVVRELPAKPELALRHDNYRTVTEFIERLNRYSGIQAESEQRTRSPFKAFSQEWLSRFFAHEGYRDGYHGELLSLLQSFSEVAVQAKKWQLEGEKERTSAHRYQELREFQKELNFWLADWQVKNSSGLVQLWWKLRRKFSV